MPSQKNSDEKSLSAVTTRLIELILQIPAQERGPLLQELEKKYKKGMRKSPRENYFMDVTFATRDRAFKGFIHNISDDGVLIESKGTFHVGQKLTMTFSLSKKLGPIKIEGEIARISPEGLGIKFSQPIQEVLNESQNGFI